MNHGDIWGASDLFAAPQHIASHAKTKGLNPITFARGKGWIKRRQDPVPFTHPVAPVLSASEVDLHDVAHYMKAGKRRA